MGVSHWFSIAGLHVMSRWPRWWSRTKVFLSSGNKTLFSCALFKKKNLLYWPPTWLPSVVMWLQTKNTWQTWRPSVPAASEHSDNLLKTSEHCGKCPNVFQWALSTSKAISKVTIVTCCDTVTTLQVKIFVQWPFGDQLFGFSHLGKFLGAKLY